jgi:hypothetical protein
VKEKVKDRKDVKRAAKGLYGSPEGAATTVREALSFPL